MLCALPRLDSSAGSSCSDAAGWNQAGLSAFAQTCRLLCTICWLPHFSSVLTSAAFLWAPACAGLCAVGMLAGTSVCGLWWMSNSALAAARADQEWVIVSRTAVSV